MEQGRCVTAAPPPTPTPHTLGSTGSAKMSTACQDAPDASDNRLGSKDSDGLILWSSHCHASLRTAAGWEKSHGSPHTALLTRPFKKPLRQ